MQSAIRIAFILNGGAIIAALSVYGALNDNLPTEAGPYYSDAISRWVIGLVCATVAVFFIGYAQRQFQAQAGANVNALAKNWFDVEVSITEVRGAKLGQFLRILAIIVWACSIVAFVLGAIEAIPGALIGDG